MCELIEFKVSDMKNSAILLTACVIVSGCGGVIFPNPFEKADPPEIAVPVVLSEEKPVILGAEGQSADALDNTSATELAKAENVSGGNSLGSTVASLGDVTEQGLWLKTPLVSAKTSGRIEAAGGKSLAVTLIPIEGEASAGSRISLAAMRGLGLGLTDLPTLKVFRVSAAG